MFPFPYPYPGMAFPEYFQSHMWNNTNPPNLNIKPKQTSAEYDPLNPENNKKKRPNPYKDRKIPSETDNKPVITPDNNPELDISEENKQILAENQSKREKKSPTKAKKTIKDTVFIKNIPNYYNTVETLSKFYKKFGSIETINVEQSKLLASVKFMKALDAVKAVNSNKKLFGRDEIFVTLNPDEEIPIKKDNNLNQQTNNKVNNNLQTQQSETKKDEPVKKSNSLLVGKISKLNEMKSKKEKDEMKNMILKKITQKLKFMLFIKSRFGNENSQDKENLINELNKLKNYKDDIVKGKYDETLKTIYDHELSDYSYDFTLIIKNLPDTSLNYANLTSKLQVFFILFNIYC